MEFINLKQAQDLQNALIFAQENNMSRRANYFMQNYFGLSDFNARGIRKNTPYEYADYLRSNLIQTNFNKTVSSENFDNLLADLQAYVEMTADTPKPSKPKPQPTQQNTTENSDRASIPAKKQPESPKGKVSSDENGVSAAFNLNINIMELLKNVVDEKADVLTAEIDKKIKEVAKTLQPNVIQLSETKIGEVTGKMHKSFEESIKILSALKTLFISGPTGSGKTFLAEQLAKALDLEFGFMSISAGISEAHLAGRMLVDGTYVPAEFVRIYENGGVFLLDEVDSADPNTLLFLNSAIANGRLFVPNRKDNPVAKRHENFYLICSGNTWGNGGFEYVGREKLDKAFLDRFELAKVLVEYDIELEQNITESSMLTKKLQLIRKYLKDTERSVSTRSIINAHVLSKSGFSDNDILDKLTLSYSTEETNKVVKALEDCK